MHKLLCTVKKICVRSFSQPIESGNKLISIVSFVFERKFMGLHSSGQFAVSKRTLDLILLSEPRLNGPLSWGKGYP